ncbi:hypothetical protein [Cytobacillus purgationiresistens]|uniref:Uncharacterized protein n=1 Tax=Cytobacillus purgationiresistens TaxID=863449 RepID=A0ABU0ADD8_9BACI|nr:hypothetical protein [Cytobacillus purgationiresistens]MDQ0269055.1 hypothetical protein [Cytobacillus purgationiresistens]
MWNEITSLFVFFLLFGISSFFNIMFKMTEKKHCLTTLLISLILTPLIIGLLGIV